MANANRIWLWDQLAPGKSPAVAVLQTDNVQLGIFDTALSIRLENPFHALVIALLLALCVYFRGSRHQSR